MVINDVWVSDGERFSLNLTDAFVNDVRRDGSGVLWIEFNCQEGCDEFDEQVSLQRSLSGGVAK